MRAIETSSYIFDEDVESLSIVYTLSQILPHAHYHSKLSLPAHIIDMDYSHMWVVNNVPHGNPWPENLSWVYYETNRT